MSARIVVATAFSTLASLGVLYPVTTCADGAGLSCMVAPTERKVVSSRFGIFRPGGTANHGGTPTAHQHDGLDFSTGGVAKPLFATTAGEVTFAGPRGSAGNTVLIRRPNGDIVGYYHLSAFAPGIRQGAQVQPGQTIGLSGNTNSGSAARGNMAVHLHFVYGQPAPGQARSAAFSGEVGKSGNPLNPRQLSNKLTNPATGIGWRTDPAPFFCESFRIEDGHPHRISALGATTKEQHAILFGSVPPGGAQPNTAYDDVQIAAANTQAVLAAADGQGLAFSLEPGDGFGTIPQPPIGDYEHMSPLEMMMTEANRRFMSAEWNAQMPQASSRAIYIDLLMAQGVSSYMDESIYNKKQRVEALLAIYNSMKMQPLRQEVDGAYNLANRSLLKRLVN